MSLNSQLYVDFIITYKTIQEEMFSGLYFLKYFNYIATSYIIKLKLGSKVMHYNIHIRECLNILVEIK